MTDHSYEEKMIQLQMANV